MKKTGIVAELAEALSRATTRQALEQAAAETLSRLVGPAELHIDWDSPEATLVHSDALNERWCTTYARLISAAGGGSGISLEMFDYLAEVYASGLSPAVPAFGSIGAADLTHNATLMLALLGNGRMWRAGELVEAGAALEAAGLRPPPLQPKDAMALINHGGLSVALAAIALSGAEEALAMSRAAILLSYAGYEANTDILAPEINALRPAPGQQEMAAWLAARLQGGAASPRRVQEALSFRVVAPVMGAACAALDHAQSVWRGEANGLSDSPAVLGDDAMRSTANFHAPALALALESRAPSVARNQA